MTVAVGSGPCCGVRGGSWAYLVPDACAAFRTAGNSSGHAYYLGLRLARRVP